MHELGKALKVSIYVTDGATHRGAATSSSLLDFLFYRGVSGATVLKGVAGFGSDHHLHTASLVDVSDCLPVKVEFIDTPEKVEELLPKLRELAGSGMIEVQETMIVKAATTPSGQVQAPLTHHKVEGRAKLLRIYIDEKDRWHEKSLDHALVEALRANDIAGVTVYKAILGYGSGRKVHGRHVFSEGASLMLSVIDTEEKVRGFLPILDKMMPNGLVVLSDVDIITYRYGEAARNGSVKEERNA
jgi:PII-like signaling protein